MLFYALLGAVLTICAADVPVVRTSSGLVSGQRFLVNNKLVDAFYGIPFAEPPVGELRFQRPRRVRPWKGVYNATKKPTPCRQLDLRFLKSVTLHYDTSSEDCLYLNIWRPAKPECRSGRCPGKLPVIVFVHGGAFQWGDSGLFIYDMETFVSRSDVVFVTFNYRIGVFGFLTTNTPDAPANNGLWDQNLVLKWVRENIASFGGDRNDVTFAGQSAGGMSVGFHAVSPYSRGLFKKAVMQSGTPLSAILWRAQSSDAKMRNIAGVLGCYNSTRAADEQVTDIVSCLKKLNAQVIMDAVRDQDPANQLFFPVFGDSLMPCDPQAATTWAELGVRGLLLGTTRDEGTLFVENIRYVSPQIDLLLKQDYRLAVIAFVSTTFGIQIKEARGIVAKYYGDYDVEHDSDSVFAIFARVVGDALFDCPTHFFANLTARSGIPTYRYVFDHRPSFSLWPKSFGVAHSDDIYFFYGSDSIIADKTKHTDILDADAQKLLSGIQVTEEEKLFSRELIRILYKFVKSGKPGLLQQSRSWPAYSSSSYPSVFLRANTSTTGTFHERCEIWKPYLYNE